MEILANLFWCILGIAGGAVFSICFKARKKLTRKIFTVNLISEEVSSINGLEINYDSQPIKNLYTSTIQIKNTGNWSIRKDDIPRKNPLSIYTDGTFIIDNYSILPPSPDNENDIQVIFNNKKEGSSSSANIVFDF